ncbi:MAG: hypothetical protein WKF73_12085 [Nocardioidaceae bacterium]
MSALVDESAPLPALQAAKVKVVSRATPATARVRGGLVTGLMSGQTLAAQARFQTAGSRFHLDGDRDVPQWDAWPLPGNA